MTRITRIARTAIFAAALLLPAASAQAAVITVFNSEAAWLAAVGAVTLEDFADGTLATGLTSITGSNPPTIGGGVLNDRLGDGVGVTSTTFAFNPAILGFGGIFDLSPGGAGTGIQVAVDFLGGGSQIVGSEIPSNLAGSFWGFTSDTPILDVRFAMGSDPNGSAETYALDNLQFSAAAVPEPATLLIFGAGIGAVAVRRRLKGRA